jgi:hypothetical protein
MRSTPWAEITLFDHLVGPGSISGSGPRRPAAHRRQSCANLRREHLQHARSMGHRSTGGRVRAPARHNASDSAFRRAHVLAPTISQPHDLLRWHCRAATVTALT